MKIPKPRPSAVSRPQSGIFPVAETPRHSHSVDSSRRVRTTSLFQSGDGLVGLNVSPRAPSSPDIPSASPSPENSDSDGMDIDAPPNHSDPSFFSYQGTNFSSASQSHAARHRQAFRWMNEVLPPLVPVLLRVLRESQNLRNLDQLTPSSCGCLNARQLDVVCISQKEMKPIQICSCDPARHLLTRGYFPCAPLVPTLAVDLNLLDLTTRLFLRSSPGVTSWADTLEDYLHFRGFSLRTDDSLRIRFGNALRWWGYLWDLMESRLEGRLEEVKEVMGDVLGREDSNELANDNRMDRSGGLVEDGQGVDRVPRTVPSAYLKRRCPLCFGGRQHLGRYSSLMDLLLAIDACFTHKRSATSHGRDPSMTHPDTLWLSEDEVSQMEDAVNETRGRQPNPNPSPKVPDDVVDECQQGHKASNESEAKANPVFFADTGIMAILCRHDRPLFLANMTSAGEKQHYALVLIRRVIEEIPADWTIGLLYDIACVLERSCIKWGFLGDELSRIRFAVSIFHAYGHQYTCQLLYHPRKCPGCGLYDGEGCERFWSLLKGMIGILRVSGYHQRLHSLDRRVHFLARKSYAQFGSWIRRKWALLSIRQVEAEETLRRVAVPLERLRREWANEVESEIKPARSLHTKKTVERLMDRVASLFEQRKECQKKLRKLRQEDSSSTPSRPYMEIADELREVSERADTIKDQLQALQTQLGVERWRGIEKVMEDEVMHLRLRALTYKQQLRTRLRLRKRELERSERAASLGKNAANSSGQKLTDRIEQYVHSKESSITAIWKKFDATLTKMKALLDQRMNEARAQGRAFRLTPHMPRRIPKDRLWTLDVDDEIWNDIGLGWSDIGEPIEDFPAWLSDDEVRDGIRAMLEKDRCDEEAGQLRRDRRILQEVAWEHWTAINAAIAHLKDQSDAVSADWACAFETRRVEALGTIVQWHKEVHHLPLDIRLVEDSWGPSPEDMQDYVATRWTSFTMPVPDDEDRHETVDEDVDLEHMLDNLIL